MLTRVGAIGRGGGSAGREREGELSGWRRAGPRAWRVAETVASEEPGDVVLLGGDLEPAHRARALGAARKVVEEHVPHQPSPGVSDEAHFVVVLVQVELAWRRRERLVAGRLGHDFAAERSVRTESVSKYRFPRRVVLRARCPRAAAPGGKCRQT